MRRAGSRPGEAGGPLLCCAARMQSATRSTAANDRATRSLLFATVFLDVAGFGMILPLLPYYGKHYGADPFRVGALFACYSLAQAVCAPVLGGLSDRFGRRPVLLIALVANAGALLLLAAGDTEPHHAVRGAHALRHGGGQLQHRPRPTLPTSRRRASARAGWA